MSVDASGRLGAIVVLEEGWNCNAHGDGSNCSWSMSFSKVAPSIVRQVFSVVMTPGG